VRHVYEGPPTPAEIIQDKARLWAMMRHGDDALIAVSVKKARPDYFISANSRHWKPSLNAEFGGTEVVTPREFCDAMGFLTRRKAGRVADTRRPETHEVPAPHTFPILDRSAYRSSARCQCSTISPPYAWPVSWDPERNSRGRRRKLRKGYPMLTHLQLWPIFRTSAPRPLTTVSSTRQWR